MTPTTNRHTVDLALLAVALAWGSSYLAAKESVTPDTVFAVLTLRFGIAAAGLTLVVAPRLRRLTRHELAWGAVFGAILGVVLVLETFGVTKTSAANAGLIISLTIVVTPLLDRRAAVPRLSATFYWSAAVAVAGVGLLTQNGGFATPSLGDLLMLLAAVARSVHVIVISRVSAGRALDPGRVTLVQFAAALGIFVVLSGTTGRGVVDVATQMTAYSWLLVLHLALSCTIFAFVVQMWAARRTSPARVSVLLGTEPLWAAAIGVTVAGDPVTVAGVVGAVLILTGTYLARSVEGRAGGVERAAAAEAMTPTSP
ncbi:DMT family transporter [Mycobacterium hodleri]|uniref:DMT family transporter n=1 Tax=Mycolicibacterium hodleri TaxID=49897 RepID=UPI0021F3A16F|nr:DMT family transporter [Mycolicibacterium hodleri]MCV7135425.1 DMT family transporter [Mycolicibacterium hodleri]